MLINATNTEFVLRSQIGSITKQTIVTRGGSEETDFKTAAWDHMETVLANAPSASTALPCSVITGNKLTRYVASTSFNTLPTTINVPTGNSGDIQLRIDPGAYTLNYVQNGGSPTAVIDSDIITFADGDTLYLSISGAEEQSPYYGYLVDVETGQRIDSFQLVNTTITP